VDEQLLAAVEGAPVVLTVVGGEVVFRAGSGDG
jgi:hypothetical protein